MEERFKEIKIHDRRVETYQEDVLAFIHQERQLAKKEVLEEIMKNIIDCEAEHNEARHGASPQDAYERCSYVIKKLAKEKGIEL